MDSNKHDIHEVNPFFKAPVSSFPYDLALWAKMLNEMHPFAFSSLLNDTSDFPERIRTFAKQVEKVKPASFAHRLRCYIFDHRLRVLFLAVDDDGELTQDLFLYGKQRHDIADNVYGDEQPFLTLDLSSKYGYHNDTVEAFVKKYDFTPLELFGSSSLVIMENDAISSVFSLSPYEVVLLTKRYASSNLVDWDEHCRWYDFLSQ